MSQWDKLDKNYFLFSLHNQDEQEAPILRQFSLFSVRKVKLKRIKE